MQGVGAYIGGSANFIKCNLFDNEATYVRARVLKPLWSLLPAPRWNVTRLIAYFCMQGGGVAVEEDGIASFINCNLYDNVSPFRARGVPGGAPATAPLDSRGRWRRRRRRQRKPVSVWPGAGAACACGREACCHCRFGSTGTRYVMLGLGQGHITAAAVDDGDGWDDGGDDG